MKDRATVSIVMAIIAPALLAGCGGPRVWVTMKPQFDYRNIKTMAVLPFENASDYPGAGRVVFDKLTSLLVQNGSYRILSRAELKDIFTEHNLPLSIRMNPSQAIKIGRLARADAILTGTVDQYNCDVMHETRFCSEPIWGPWDDYGDIPDYYEVPYDWYTIDARVDISLMLTNTSTGEVMWSDSKQSSFNSSGSPPTMSRSETLSEASDTAVRKLFLGLVVYQEKVKVPPRSLFTCSEYIDHPIDRRKKFSSRDPNIYVVIDLNSDFVGKEILLRVEKKDTGALVSKYTFKWDNTSDMHAFKLDTKNLIGKGGYGKYRATYYMDGEKIAQADFKIARP